MSTTNTQNASSNQHMPCWHHEEEQQLTGVGAPAHTPPTMPRANEAQYANAAQQMFRGKLLVIVGFGVLAIGILTYCVVGVSGEPNQVFGMTSAASSNRLTISAQVAMAIGTLLWLVGSFLYLLGAVDSDPEGPDLYF